MYEFKSKNSIAEKVSLKRLLKEQEMREVVTQRQQAFKHLFSKYDKWGWGKKKLSHTLPLDFKTNSNPDWAII